MIANLKKPLLWSLLGAMTVLSFAQPAEAILGVWRRTAVRVAVIDTAATTAAVSSAAAAAAAQKSAAPPPPAAVPAAPAPAVPATTPPK